MNESNGHVSFTAKELIQALDRKLDKNFDSLDTKLDSLTDLVAGKANSADVLALSNRVTVMEGELKHRENQSHKHDNRIAANEARVIVAEKKLDSLEAIRSDRRWMLIVAPTALGGFILALLRFLHIA